MNISKYKKYIRDMNVSDDELEEIVSDVIEDIAMDTKIFKNTIGFKLDGCVREYDIEAIYELYSNLDDQVINIEYTSNSSTESTLKLIDMITIDDGDNKTTCEDKNNDDSVDEDITYSSSKSKFISANDLFVIFNDTIEAESRKSKTLIKSIENEYFERYNNFVYKSKHEYLSDLYGSEDYSIDVYVNCSIVPSAEQINDDQERMLRTALINGLKYFSSDMYLNTSNEQVSNLLYQRYYSSKKQLLYNNPQFVSPKLDFRNSGWNQ